MAIARAQYLKTRTKGNRNVSQNAARKVWYCTYERNVREQRGVWYGQGGAQSYQQVREWAREQSQSHKYVYELLLSVSEGVEARPEDFRQVMDRDERFGDYRLIEHTNTDNRHAHVIVFTDKTLRRNELMAWQRETCRQLEQVERDRQLQAQQEQATELQREQQALEME